MTEHEYAQVWHHPLYVCDVAAPEDTQSDALHRYQTERQMM